MYSGIGIVLSTNTRYRANELLRMLEQSLPHYWATISEEDRADILTSTIKVIDKASSSSCAFVAAEAYQVIGSLAGEDFDCRGVQKALDYFNDIANEESCKRHTSILPWSKDENN